MVRMVWQHSSYTQYISLVEEKSPFLDRTSVKHFLTKI
ncbi:hypothetical protein APA_2463 [Pseudanabaena sp. lw0831]|nr:hypothetical protein APA_2463 [Pseudanabaena sp. lw0831]